MKIRNQINAFNEAGLCCNEIVLPRESSKWNSIKSYLPFSNVYPRWTYKEEYDNADFLYMRRPYVMTSAMRRVLRKARKRNPKIKIIIEIPTYPYDQEYQYDKLVFMILAKDRYNRRRMNGIVDYYAVLEDTNTVFGLPAIKIVNGINVDEIHKRVPRETNPEEIHLCAVASFRQWHGYDRVIEGMKDYYHNGGERNIICHFVGDGDETEVYRKMMNQYGLDDHFVFHGYLEGKALDEVYNECTLSLGVFGMYRKGLNLSSDLKSRDAVARGIPSITGCRTDIFVKDRFPYFLEFPNDPSPVDFKEIIEFHDRIYKDGQEKVISAIRAYAGKTVDMQAAMKNVIDFYKS